MKKLLYVFWFVPAWLLFLAVSQYAVFRGLQDTYENGIELTGVVEDFRIKHIASQTNGYIVLRITPPDGPAFSQKLSLPVQVAAKVQNAAGVAIRYKPGSFQEIVMIPTYTFHRNMVTVNLAVLLISIFITILIALGITRFIRRPKDSPELTLPPAEPENI